MSKTGSGAAVAAAELILRASPAPMLLYSPDLILLYANAAYERMIARPATDLVGRYMFDAFPPGPGGDATSARAMIEETVARMRADPEAVIEAEVQHNIPNEAGEYEDRFWAISQWAIHDAGEFVAVLQQADEVTARVRQQRLTDAVRQSAEEISGLAFFSYDPATDRFSRNSAIDAMFGFKPEEAGPLAAPFFERIVPEDLPAVREELERAFRLGAGTSAAYDYRVMVPGLARPRYIRVRSGVERDPADGVLKLFGAFVDLTDIEEARAQMAELSARNAALVVESNHRIKNSLAIASAMLTYPMRGSEDAAVRQALQAAATRIMAISDVHGELFADSGIEWVDAGRLLERFVASFTRTISQEGQEAPIAASVASVLLPSRYAVTMALMLNELLTNAVKYGMLQDRGCEVSVSLASSDRTACLTVENTIASDRFAQIVSEGVGTELVHAFAEQLCGTIETLEDGGRFRVTFLFPIPDAELDTREADSLTAH